MNLSDAGLNPSTLEILSQWRIDSPRLLGHFTVNELKALGIDQEEADRVGVYLLRETGRQQPYYPATIAHVGREYFGSSWDMPIQFAFVRLTQWFEPLQKALLRGMNALIQQRHHDIWRTSLHALRRFGGDSGRGFRPVFDELDERGWNTPGLNYRKANPASLRSRVLHA